MALTAMAAPYSARQAANAASIAAVVLVTTIAEQIMPISADRHDNSLYAVGYSDAVKT
jgi:hypothetical protein